MPGMPGSFGLLNGPLEMITYRVVIRSPRSVVTVHRHAVSSQLMVVTSVWKHASRYRSKVLAMAWACPRISSPLAYFSVGR